MSTGANRLSRYASHYVNALCSASGLNKIRRAVAALCTASLLSGAATVGQAQTVLLAWNTTGNSGITPDPYAATTTGANMEGSALNRGSGLTATSLNNAYAASGWDGPSDLAGAAAANNYFQFVAAASSGYSFSADEIFMNFRTTGTGPMTIQWQYSFDGFATAGSSIQSPINRTNSGSGTQIDNYSIDLSAITALQETTETVTFRLFGWNASGSAGTAAFGTSTGNNLSLSGTTQPDGPPPANNNSVLSIPATSAFGRVMEGSSQSVTVSNTGDATTFSTDATGGFSSPASGSVTEDGTSGVSVGVGSTLGNRSGVLTVTNTAADSAGPGEGSDQGPITSDLSATVVQNRVIEVGEVAGTDFGGIDLGRQMLGTVSGTHTLTSPGADSENTRLTFRSDAENIFGGYAASGLAEVRASNATSEDVVLNGSTTAQVAYELDFTQTGSRVNDSQFILFNTANAFDGEGLADEVPLSAQPTPGTNQMRIYLQNATIVDNREIETTQVDLGSVLVGTTTGAETTTLTTSGDDDHRTRVTVQSDSVSSNGVTVASAATATLFDSADAETTRSVSGNFATSGSKDIDVNLVVTGEGLTGEAVNPVVVNAIAEVYQAASLTANNTTDVASGGNVQLSNAATNDGGQRAAAQIVSRELTGATAWSVSGLAVDTDINADASASGTATLDTAGLLAGTHMAIFTLGAQHADQGITGTSANDLGTFSWTLSQEVVSTGGGSATVLEGQPYSEFNTVRDGGADTALSFLGGVASTERELVIGFADAPAGNFFSDVVTITGLTGDRFVLSVSYDPDLLDGFPVEQLFLGWDDGASFINAVLGNVQENDVTLAIPYVGTWQDYQDETSRTLGNALGAYGVDGLSNTVWAVLDHNSAFSVIPEPSTYAIFIGMLAFALILLRRRARS